MSEYKKVKIGDFLEQYRNTIWIDDSVEYGQITISSKDGVKFRCLKIGKEIGRKRQFVIDLKSHPNTVIFTRQGIADGSIGIAPSNVNGCIATENMPMFSVNENIILVEYLENLLISPVFKELVATITPSGSAQKSIHERDLLQLEITLPDLETQKEIVKKVSINLKNVETLTKEIESQKAYAKQLRQNILQDAIEGKLTAEWRKTHPVIKGNPDFDAEALFEEIQKEKKSDIKQKELAPIGDDEKLFEIPEGWKWVRLGEITTLITDGKHGDSVNQANSGYFFLSAKDIQNEQLVYSNAREITEKDFLETHRRTNLEPGDICIVNTGATVGKLAIAPEDEKTYKTTFQKSVAVVKLVKHYINNKFMKYFFMRDVPRLMEKSWGSAINNLLLSDMRMETVPLPSYREQDEIVTKIEILLSQINEVEHQISQREEYANQLMQGILKDAFEE